MGTFLVPGTKGMSPITLIPFQDGVVGVVSPVLLSATRLPGNRTFYSTYVEIRE